MSNQIPLGLIGISHKTAPVEIREKVALNEEEQKTAIRQVINKFNASGCMILSTCNRTEVYFSNGHVKDTSDKIRRWLNDFNNCSEYTNTEITY